MNIGLIIMSTAAKTKIMEENEKIISAVVPLQIIFNEKTLDSNEVSLDTLFSEVEKSKQIPQTSQPSPLIIENSITNGLKTFDKLIMITPHSEISGTYQNCINVVKQNNLLDEVKVIESNGGIATTEAMLIDFAIELINKQLSFTDIIEQLNQFNEKLVIYTFPGDFKYLKVSGRVSGVTASVLSTLNIRIVVKMTSGKPIIDNKGRGEKSILKYIENEFDASKVSLVYYTAIKDNLELKKAVFDTFAQKGITVFETKEANSVPAAHLGPNNFGLGVLYKK